MDATAATEGQATAEVRAVSPWWGWWIVVLVALACLGVSTVALFFAAFGGHSSWRAYLMAGLVWCVPLFSLSMIGLGRRTRQFALVLAVLGAAILLVELPSFLRNPGWQF